MATYAKWDAVQGIKARDLRYEVETESRSSVNKSDDDLFSRIITAIVVAIVKAIGLVLLVSVPLGMLYGAIKLVKFMWYN